MQLFRKSQIQSQNKTAKTPAVFLWLGKWLRLDIGLYFSAFKFRALIPPLALTFIFVLSEKIIKSLINGYLVCPIFQWVPDKNISADIVILLTGILTLIFLFKQIIKQLLPTLNSLIWSVTILIIYVYGFRSSNEYVFYQFNLPLPEHLFYSDILLASLLVLTSNYKSFFNKLDIPKTRYALLTDGSTIDKYTDAYGRTEYANTIAEHINKTSTDNSFAIAVTGEWGSGKTDFLSRLKKTLEESTDNICFDFNPWRVNKPDAIIEEFFKSLTVKLQPYNQSIAAKIRDYSKRILQTSKDLQFRLVDALLGDWIPEESIQGQYENINAGIESIGKRIVVFIDDLDRLTGSEVMEVLRLIRNTANFSNTFFIVGIDQKYIVEVLKNTKHFSNEEEYLKKVFQLVITLPAFKKEIFSSKVKEFIITDDLSPASKTKLTDTLGRLGVDFPDETTGFAPPVSPEHLLEKLNANLRDLKRFCNSFKIAFNILEDETDIYDLFLLELIRNKNIEVYNKIRDRSLLKFEKEHSDQFALNDEDWQQFTESKKGVLPPEDLINLEEALQYLLADRTFKNNRKLKLAHNFFLYFSYQLFNLISLKEFNETIEKDYDQVLAKFNEWANAPEKLKELLVVTEYLLDFKDASFLQKMAAVYLNIKESKEYWRSHVRKLIFEHSAGNLDQYFEGDQTKQETFLKEIMADKKISLFDRALLANQFLEVFIKPGRFSNKVLDKKQWQEIILGLFDSYLAEIVHLDPDSIIFLMLNDNSRVSGDRIVLNPAATQKLKDALTTKPGFFEDYVAMFIRPYGYPYSSGGEVTFEPFMEQIFTTWGEFKKILEKAVFKNGENDKLRKIILKHIDTFYAKKDESFIIKDRTDQLFVDSIMLKHAPKQPPSSSLSINLSDLFSS